MIPGVRGIAAGRKAPGVGGDGVPATQSCPDCWTGTAAGQERSRSPMTPGMVVSRPRFTLDTLVSGPWQVRSLTCASPVSGLTVRR
jgi:hypothetical protein